MIDYDYFRCGPVGVQVFRDPGDIDIGALWILVRCFRNANDHIGAVLHGLKPVLQQAVIKRMAG